MEILVLGVVLFAGVMITTARSMSGGESREGENEQEILLQWTVGHLAAALLSTAPMIVAGISTWVGAGGGRYWALAEIVSGLIASVLYAWVLLIEILR